MRIKLYVGGELAFDNYLPKEEGYGLHSLAIADTVNKGGTATVLLPAAHPKRDSFRPYAVPVEIYRDGKLRWRGRPLPLDNEDMYGRKKILCEGEMCFLQDAVHRPYTYKAEAEEVFGKVLAVYNAAVEPWKRFSVGVVTVKGVAEILNKNPESCLEVIRRLVEACGGYILFDDAPDGSRRINWYKDFPYTCNQTVRYGYNLTDCNRKDGLTGFATRIIPYGKADNDGNRLKIDVDGKDYVENPEAVAEYGVVEGSVTYNDIEDPEQLRLQAERDVGIYGLVPSVISMSAIDMSRQDLSLDAFAIGQQVPAESVRHDLSGYYYLTGITEDLVNPKVGGITLQRELASIGSKKEQTLSAAVAVSRKSILSAASDNTDMSVAGITHEFILNKLTNYGALKGIYELDGVLLINADFIKSGTIAADIVKSGKLVSEDGQFLIDLDNSTLRAISGTGKREMFLSAGALVGYGCDVKSGEKFRSIVIQPGYVDDLGQHVASAIHSDASDVTLSAGDGMLLVLGRTTHKMQLYGKSISWQDNGDGTYTLIGKDG